MKTSQKQSCINNLAVPTLVIPNTFLSVVLTVLEVFEKMFKYNKTSRRTCRKLVKAAVKRRKCLRT